MSAGWGSVTWGYEEWGELGNALVIPSNTNLLATANLGQETITTEINLGWGRDQWGDNGWGILGTLQTTGVAGTIATGTASVDGEINLGWGRQAWGANGWGIQGTLQTSSLSATASLSSVNIDAQITVGWGRDAWGAENWGESTERVFVNNTNLLMSAAEGSAGLAFDGDSNLTLTGIPLTMSAPATVEAFAAFVAEPTGFPLTMQLGYDPEIINPNSFPMTMSQGTAIGDANTIADVSAASIGYWGYKSTWGFSAWGSGSTNTLVMSMLENFSGADPAPDAVATGMAGAIALSSISNFEIKGDANIAPLANMNWGDGTWGESRWGNGQYRPDTDDIFPLTAALGTATLTALTPVDVTGFNITASLNNVAEVIGDGKVIPTGFALTNALGTATNVLIWNEVNTGTAPVTPPGWQEVDTNAA